MPLDDDFNPYASPEPEAPWARDGGLHDLRFPAAGEVVRLEGVISPRDLFHANRLVNRSTPSDAIGCAIVLLFMLLPWGFILSAWGVPNAMRWTCLAVLVLAAVLGNIAFSHARRMHRCWHRGRGIFGPQRIEIAVSGIRQETEAGLAVYQWTAFSKYVASNRVVLLEFDPPSAVFYEPPSAFLVIPRTFFTNDGEWIRFVNFVKAKLPQKYRESRNDWN